MTTRYIIEGEWSGYHSEQARIVHRTVHKAAESRLRDWVQAVGSIAYTDGTRLLLYVRDAKPRERIRVLNGYTSLIKDCFRANVSSVALLPRKG